MSPTVEIEVSESDMELLEWASDRFGVRVEELASTSVRGGIERLREEREENDG